MAYRQRRYATYRQDNPESRRTNLNTIPLQAELIISQLTLGKLSLIDAKRAIDEKGSAEEALEFLSSRISANFPHLAEKAKAEEEWCQKNKVRIITISDPDYPQRLKNCCDAPMVLFVRGKANLNAQHAISIVGTRQCTSYGRDCIDRIVDKMAEKLPNLHIVSGLAYGIDIAAHRAALRNGLPTIGIVAHGQATLYPAHHRSEANKMVLGNGAVITEFFHDVFPEARNFLQRNRIIAGMSDATLIPESASHGGGMVTARLAIDYNRELFAIPGSVLSPMSEGPNNLIRDNKATLVTSAEDITNILGWHDEKEIQQARKEGIERELFTDFSDDEQKIVAVLQHGDQSINSLSQATELPISTISATIFALEMKGFVRALSGNQYHLVK